MSHRLWHTHLLDRLSGTVDEVLDGALGVYGTQPTGNLALLARLEGFGPEDLLEALGDGRAVRLRTLRGSGIVIPRHMLPVTQVATRDRNVRAVRGMIEKRLTADTYEGWSERILEVLDGETLTASQIRKSLDTGVDEGLILYVVAAMAAENRIVGVPVEGGWRTDGRAFAVWEDRFPNIDVWSIDPAEAREGVARLYLDRYGPATIDDLSWWSGMGKRHTRSACEAVATRVGDTGMWMTTPRGEDPPFGVRLLPVWDPLMVGYKDRSRFIPEDRYPYVYDRDGNATSVILGDGVVAGVWSLGRDDDRLEIRVAGFDPLDKSMAAGIAEEAGRIGEMVGSSEVKVVDHGTPVRLTDAPRNRFLRPLG